MQRLLWSALAAVLLLAACDRPPQPVEAAAVSLQGAVSERAGPVTWDAERGLLHMDGKPLRTVKLWTFDGSTEGFTGVGSTVAPAAGQGLALRIADPTLRSPRGLNVPGGQFPLVLVRLTRAKAGGPWDGALYYATQAHGEAVGYLGKPVSGADPKVNETTTLIYDMGQQAVGGPDWTNSIIDQIRFDIDDKPGGAFIIHQVAIAARPEGAPPPAAKP